MNQATRDIMKLLGVDAAEAMKIQENMEIDFSECSQREFNKAARVSAAAFGIGRVKPVKATGVVLFLTVDNVVQAEEFRKAIKKAIQSVEKRFGVDYSEFMQLSVEKPQ